MRFWGVIWKIPGILGFSKRNRVNPENLSVVLEMQPPQNIKTSNSCNGVRMGFKPTNNEAEYDAILVGPNITQGLGASNVEV